MPDIEKLEALAGSCLSSSACFAALMILLRNKGVISETEEREMYEGALLMLKAGQGADPATIRVYELAREVIEAQLRTEKRGGE